MGAKTKKVLVTGGAGFLGSHLCEKLLEKGHDVFCLDNFVTGTWENIAHLRTHIAFNTIHHDVSVPYYGEVDQIYHLACPSLPNYCEKNPVETTKTHIVGGLNLLELAKRCSAPILLVSSLELGLSTKYCSLSIIKKCAENLFYDYSKKYGIKVKIARLSECYGPKMSLQSKCVIGPFIIDALEDKTLTHYGDEDSQTRSLCYYTDAIGALIALMGTDNIAEPINIGHPHEISLKKLAKKVISISNSSSKTKRISAPQKYLEQTNADISLAKEILNWKPEVALDTGLRQTIAYFRGRLSTKL